MPIAAPVVLALALGAATARDEEAVKAADVAMAAASRDRDLAVFLGFLADDALFGAAAGLADGKAAVRAELEPLFAPGGPSLTWTPQRAVVAASGDLAFTIGHFTRTGDERASEGSYVTVWRKHGQAWKALLDMANRPATSLGPGLRRAPARTVRARAGDLEAVAGTWKRDVPRSGAHQEGTFLIVRRRTHAGDWQPVVDSALVTRKR
jgi:ketosteroid isomerase-like protein